MARVGIIGGGLAGLTVAYRRVARGDSVVLLEAAPRLGGQLSTERTEGFVIEHGAEGFVANSVALPRLAADLGIAGSLIGQSTLRSYGFDGTTLISLAPGQAGAFLGFQVASDDLGRGIRTFRGGMGELTDVLESALAGRAELHRSAQVSSVEWASQGLRIVRSDGSTLEVDRLVVATPARVAAALLGPLLDDEAETARSLAGAAVVSLLTVALAYDRDAVGHPLDATGFVVADPARLLGVRACTFTSSKFEARAPEGQASLRLFFRPQAHDLATMTDAAWAERAHEALGRVLHLRAAPHRAWVSRWSDSLPVFGDEHRRRVAALELALARRHILLAGSAFHGSGIDRAVVSAETCGDFSSAGVENEHLAGSE